MRDSITLGVGHKALTVTTGEIIEMLAQLDGAEMFELLRGVEALSEEMGVLDLRTREYENARARATLEASDPYIGELLAGLEALGLSLQFFDLGALIDEAVERADFPFPNDLSVS